MTRRELPKRASRRRFLAVGVVGAAAGLSGCVLSQDGGTGASPNETNESTTGDDDRGGCAESRSGGNENVDPANRWPQFRADARNSGANLAATGPTLDGEGVTADVDRIFELQGTILSPCVYGDTIVFSTSERTHAIGVRGGDDRWTKSTGENSLTDQVVASGLIVRQRGDVIDALDPATGCDQWHVETTESVDGLITTGTIVLARSGDSGLFAHSVEDGEELWHFDEERSYLTHLAADDQCAYAGYEQTLYAIDLERGTERWHAGPEVNFEHGLGDHLAVGSDHVYVQTANQGLVALNAMDGAVAWRTPASTSVMTPPAVTSDALYLGIDLSENGGWDPEPGILALDPGDGSELWRQESLRSDITASPVVAGNGLYVTEDGTLQLLDADSGSVEATVDLEHGHDAHNLVVTDGLAHVIVGYGHTQTRLVRIKDVEE